jgi:hypothetical protein
MSRMLAASNLHNRRQAHHKENIVQHVLAQLDADVACSDVRFHQHHRAVKAAVAVVNADSKSVYLLLCAFKLFASLLLHARNR